MFSKSQIKFIKSLSRKKYRLQHRKFVVEGIKGIKELLDSPLNLHMLCTVEDVFEADPERVFLITEDELKKMSNLSSPQTALGVFDIPDQKEEHRRGLRLALDGLQDPGNLGTIIRLCDWFGIEDIFCSEDTVDCYNPKVVQATMGSIARVRIHYLPLETFLAEAQEKSFGAFLQGETVYQAELPDEGILVLGNEANGIREQVACAIDKKITIPSFGASSETESLNVATAAAIFLSEFRRRKLTER